MYLVILIDILAYLIICGTLGHMKERATVDNGMHYVSSDYFQQS